jgi:hypothetical protein
MHREAEDTKQNLTTTIRYRFAATREDLRKRML